MSEMRLDHWLVAAGLVKSRSQATRLIRAGAVKVDGKHIDKPARMVTAKNLVELVRKERYVGRGGEKLEFALGNFNVQALGKNCLDVGASTGGFTDCLLQHGAAGVLAIDVGHDQMDAGLRQDPRVRCLEGINARQLESQAFGVEFDLMVCDVSFISLTLVLPGILGQAAEQAELIALIKPQFELASQALNRKGVVRSDSLRGQAVDKVVSWFRNIVDWKVCAVELSPVVGGDGNREYLLYAKRNQTGIRSGQSFKIGS
jgi:23S rRNA (cytidine1920-2'-O)/16S rRNA (cytidine1409-2'-O)-methyltransferase